MFNKTVSSCSSSEKSEKLCCCFSVSLFMLFSATRLRVVVGPAATLGLVFVGVAVGPPDDIVWCQNDDKISKRKLILRMFFFRLRFLEKIM